MKKKKTLLALVCVGLTLAFMWPGSSAAPTEDKSGERDEVLARARVMKDGHVVAGAADFSLDPNAGLIDPDLTTCRFIPSEPTGTAPKFDCRLDDGTVVKVKYGWTREIPAEVAATRLLQALGFPADHMSRVAVLRCVGCGFSPFHTRVPAYLLGVLDVLDRRIDYSRSSEFENVAVERKLEGDGISAGGGKGWGFHELSDIDPSRGGATRAEVDALRLMAVFLVHWDNKAPNQRLNCEEGEDPSCEHPVAMLQDLGSTFGPYKVHLEGWATMPIWADVDSCTLSMKNLPYRGGTFQDVRISEEGRRLLGDRLAQLSRTQINALFVAAGFDDVDRWVAAFQDKVRQIADRSPC